MCLAFSVCGLCMWLSRNSREASWDLAVSSRDQPKTVQGRLPPRHSTRDAHTDARPSDPSQRQGLHQTTNQQNISSRTPRPRPDITHADDRNRCHHVVALNACKFREAIQRPQRVALLIRMATRGAPASDAQICSTSEKCMSTSVPEAVLASGPEAIPSRTWSSST